ncbi:MAG: hypothetical protein ACFFB3_19045, partial [Candidatus Hodarchaeota archaeon]
LATLSPFVVKETHESSKPQKRQKSNAIKWFHEPLVEEFLSLQTPFLCFWIFKELFIEVGAWTGKIPPHRVLSIIRNNHFFHESVIGLFQITRIF